MDQIKSDETIKDAAGVEPSKKPLVHDTDATTLPPMSDKIVDSTYHPVTDSKKPKSYDAYNQKTQDTEDVLKKAFVASKHPRPTWSVLENFLKKFGLSNDDIEAQKAKVKLYYPNLGGINESKLRSGSDNSSEPV